MADDAVSFVVERLGDLLTENASPLRNVSENVESLKGELIHVQDLLKVADAWPHRNDEVLRNLVAEIRVLAHDAEDIIESHVLATESPIKGCCLTATALRIYNPWNVASEIDGFTGKIKDKGKRLQTYVITREAGDRSGIQQLRRALSHIPEQHDVFGLDSQEQDAETIATKLVHGPLRSRTVSICGMGGVGKTTLAKKIYHNTEVGRHFKRAWGTVSQQCNKRDIWLKILFNLLSSNEREGRSFSELMDDQIATELYQLLEKEKCLVVLDEIWTKEAWDCLRAGFPEANKTKSKILLTTRNKEVALHVDRNCLILSLGCLNESQSWQLFCSVIARHPRAEAGFTSDENLEELGRTIVSRCGGLPLAIKTIGRTLQTKSSIDEWTTVCNTMVSPWSSIYNGRTELGIINLLALSYHDLPYHLKQCFLHFSHFPEDFIIPANTIINIWVAEGMISKGSRSNEVEDIAYEYLEGLVSRCMIQVEKRSSMGKIKSCRLHDFMRDLCIQEAKKENFVHLENGHNDEATMQSTSISKFHHLVLKSCRLHHFMRDLCIQEAKKENFVHLETGNYDEATMQSTSISKFRHLVLKNSNLGAHLNDDICDHVRSLLVLCNNMDPALLNKSLSIAMIRHLKYLRILYLDGGKVDLEIPKEIGYLVHLRLFDMGSMRTKHLPSSLGKLTQLLTLKLDCLLNVNHMPNIFENMHQLRHLYLPPLAKFKVEIMNLSQLRNLQTLVNLPLKYRSIEDLVGLPNLSKLKLKVSDEDEFNCLVRMLNISPNRTFNKLESLSVHFGWSLSLRFNPSFSVSGRTLNPIEITKVAASCLHLHKLKFSGPLVLNLPERPQNFHHLNKLTLECSNFEEDPMPHLGKLPNLRVLLLHSTLKIDAIMFPKNSFPCLQSLVFEWEKQLTKWTIQERALPHLSVLQLFFCDNLKTIPEGLQLVNSLQDLQIGAMPKEFIDKILGSHIAQIAKIVRLR